MHYTKQRITEKIEHAYQMFLRKHKFLLQVDANERSITHQFAVCLAQEFSKYNVDCEYNRMTSSSKKIIDCVPSRISSISVSSNDTEAQTVFPDIIVHRRGTDKNLLVIECKKSTAKSKLKKADQEKLQDYLYSPDLLYKFSCYIEFPIRSGKKVIVVKSRDQ